MTKKIKPITLEIDKKLWDKFKEITPRTIYLNEAIVNLIKQAIQNNNLDKQENNEGGKGTSGK